MLVIAPGLSRRYKCLLRIFNENDYTAEAGESGDIAVWSKTLSPYKVDEAASLTLSLISAIS